MLGLGLSSKPISCSNGKRSADSARLVTVVLLLRSIAAGALCAALTDTAQAGPDPCTGIGTVTCSGNQSAGVANPPPGTTILNINSLTSDIMPTNGQPGIIFENSSDITLNSDTRPYVINSVATQFEIIPGIIVSNEPVGIFLSSTRAITLTSSGNMSVVGDFGVGIFASSSGGAVTIESSATYLLRVAVAPGSTRLLSSVPSALCRQATYQLRVMRVSPSGSLPNRTTAQSASHRLVTYPSPVIQVAEPGSRANRTAAESPSHRQATYPSPVAVALGSMPRGPPSTSRRPAT
jgi:hypothetical protein